MYQDVVFDSVGILDTLTVPLRDNLVAYSPLVLYAVAVCYIVTVWAVCLHVKECVYVEIHEFPAPHDRLHQDSVDK